MTQLNYLRILIKKELMTFLKDTKTSIGVILGVLLLTPLLTWMIYGINLKTSNDNQFKVAVTIQAYKNLLATTPNVTIVDGTRITKKDVGHQVHLILKEDQLVFDSSNMTSLSALNFVNGLISQVNVETLKQNGIKPLNLSLEDIATKNATNVSSLYLSYGVILSIFLAIVGISNNTFILEKEKKSRLALLATPISKKMIFLSKLLVIVIFSVIAAMINFWGMILNSLIMAKILKDYQALNFDFFQLVTIQINFIIIAILGSLITTLIISTAKNIKESSSKITVINLVLGLSGMLASTFGFTVDTLSYSSVPFLNNFLIINAVISNNFNAQFNLVSYLVNVSLIIILVLLYIQMSKKEKYYL